ncbi:hypothetical protein [Roseivirga sp.]|uniref:hypothetical protein n=1 Tax=Roseivirga sp. TaxID=1964215 RepID=UPI003B8DB181
MPSNTKTTLIIIALCLCSISALSQEETRPDLMVTDGWGKELFIFPIRFASKIPYTGFEEARFPKGWGIESSPEFWSYAFAWKIDVKAPLTETDLEVNLQRYFDGLLGLDFKEDGQKTNAVFVSSNASKPWVGYKGKIKTLDTRFTKKPMILNVLVDQHYCKKEKQYIIIFKFSPKEFGTPVWLKMNDIKLSPEACNH